MKKLKITLELLHDRAGTTQKKGDRIEIINEVFNTKNGIAFFPIDKSEWKVVDWEEYTEDTQQQGFEHLVKAINFYKNRIEEIESDPDSVHHRTDPDQLIDRIKAKIKALELALNI